jgi:drug/metabolite transporter (DMT)-like permease
MVAREMSGILSRRPAPGPIRLLVGTQLMLLVQSLLLYEASDALPSGLQVFLLATWILGTAALIAAVRGDRDEGEPWWRRRHDH